MKGVFAFDIDGTLTHRLDGIDREVVGRLRQLVEEGWVVALVTGRMYSFAKKILQYLDFPYVLAVQNGADLLWMPEKKPLFQNYFGADKIPLLEGATRGAPEDFIIYAGIEKGDFCYFRPERFSDKALDYLRILESLGAEKWQASDFSFSEDARFPLIKCFGTQDEMQSLHERLLGIEEIEVSMIRDPVDQSLYLNLITHPEANKGGVVHSLKEHFGSDLVIAAGDDRNDRKMLENADIRIVIETAPKELLALADIIAKPAKELGIIQGIEEALIHAARP